MRSPKSAFVVQDGRSSGLTAPNGPSQAGLLRTTLKAADLTSDCVNLVSVHGTGTPLGDPIEVGALGQGFSGRLPQATSDAQMMQVMAPLC